MVEREKLEELLRRIEAATGPDRLLDHDILFAFGWTAAPIYWERRNAGSYYPFDDDEDDAPVKFHPDGDHGCWRDPNGKTIDLAEVLRLSGSVDAALALVERMLPGWSVSMYNDAYDEGEYKGAGCGLRRPTSSAVDPDIYGFGKTIPLAICDCLIRTLLAEAGTPT